MDSASLSTNSVCLARLSKIPLNRAAKSFHKELKIMCHAAKHQRPDSINEERRRTTTSKEFVSTAMKLQYISIDHGKDALESGVAFERFFKPIESR